MPSKWARYPLRNIKTYGVGRAVRHPDCDYTGEIDVHLVLNARTGCPFTRPEVAQLVCDNLPVACKTIGYRLYGYCLMPDHLHVLVSPAASGADVSSWLRRFKGYTSRLAGKLGVEPPLWQRSAYDHVCQADETAERVLAYVIENPVRAGLVERWEDWRWTKVFVEL